MAQPLTYTVKSASPNLTIGFFSFVPRAGDPTTVWGRGSVISVVKDTTGKYTATIPGKYQHFKAFPIVHINGTNVNYHARCGTPSTSGDNTTVQIIIGDSGTDSDLGGLSEVAVSWVGHSGGDDLQILP